MHNTGKGLQVFEKFNLIESVKFHFIDQFTQKLQNEFGIYTSTDNNGKWILKLDINSHLFTNKLETYKLFIEDGLVTVIASGK